MISSVLSPHLCLVTVMRSPLGMTPFPCFLCQYGPWLSPGLTEALLTTSLLPLKQCLLTRHSGDLLATPPRSHLDVYSIPVLTMMTSLRLTFYSVIHHISGSSRYDSCCLPHVAMLGDGGKARGPGKNAGRDEGMASLRSSQE